MADSLTTNPIQLTTAMTQGYKAATSSALGTLRTLRVEMVRWVGALTAGDKLTIVDPVSGNMLIDLTNPAANSTITIGWVANAKLWGDFQVTAIGSGKPYLYTL